MAVSEYTFPCKARVVLEQFSYLRFKNGMLFQEWEAIFTYFQNILIWSPSSCKSPMYKKLVFGFSPVPLPKPTMSAMRNVLYNFYRNKICRTKDKFALYMLDERRQKKIQLKSPTILITTWLFFLQNRIQIFPKCHRMLNIMFFMFHKKGKWRMTSGFGSSFSLDGKRRNECMCSKFLVVVRPKQLK